MNTAFISLFAALLLAGPARADLAETIRANVGQVNHLQFLKDRLSLPWYLKMSSDRIEYLRIVSLTERGEAALLYLEAKDAHAHTLERLQRSGQAEDRLRDSVAGYGALLGSEQAAEILRVGEDERAKAQRLLIEEARSRFGPLEELQTVLVQNGWASVGPGGNLILKAVHGRDYDVTVRIHNRLRPRDESADALRLRD